MGFTLSPNKFKSAQYIFSMIKNQWKSLGAVGQLDDTDFPKYVADVLKDLEISVYKEKEVVLTVIDGKAELPKDFMYLYAAYKGSKCCDERSEEHYQGGYYVANDITCEVLGSSRGCALDCECPDKVIQKITVRQYVGNDCTRTRQWDNICLLKLSPNVQDCCATNSPNIHCSGMDEITIDNNFVHTNFKNCDIYMQYYAFPLDEDNIPEIPDNIHVERAVEWYIKYQILLNKWFDGAIPEIQNKWGKAEQMYNDSLAQAKFINKLPGFQTMINTARNKRSINIVSYFGQANPIRIN